MSPQPILMLYLDWADHFRPMQNHLDPNASWDGACFETFGEEVAHVHTLVAGTDEEQRRIWTILDCDGKLIVSAGYQHINRMGYLITEVPAVDGQEYEIYDELEDVPRALRKQLIRAVPAGAA